jgi:hypothetical protein
MMQQTKDDEQPRPSQPEPPPLPDPKPSHQRPERRDIKPPVTTPATPPQHK